LYTFKVQNPAIAIEYDPVTKCLAVMDNECKIGVCQRDLETGEEPMSQASEGIEVDELDGFELASEMVASQQVEPAPVQDEIMVADDAPIEAPAVSVHSEHPVNAKS
jgi:hypothetical protein